MDRNEFLSLPRRRSEFVPARQQHKVLPPGIYRGDGSDTAFHNRRKVPDGLPPDALLSDCIAAVLREHGSMCVADIARELNEGITDVHSIMTRAPGRFIKTRARDQVRGVVWRLAPEDDDPELVNRVAELLRAGDATIRQIARRLDETDSVIRLLLKRNVHLFVKTGKAGKSNAAGSVWGVREEEGMPDERE